MRKGTFFLLGGALVLLSSCMYVSTKTRKDYHIKYKVRISRFIGIGNLPVEEIHNEYYIESNGKQSAVLIGYVVDSKTAVTLYVGGNAQVKHEQTFPVDDKMEIELLDHVMNEIKNQNRHYEVKNIQISMKTCGVANLNIARKYWQTKRLDKESFDQPLFNQFNDILKKYGYDVYDISNDDFYPLTAREVRIYHILPDSCSLNSIAINGTIYIECKNLKIMEWTFKGNIMLFKTGVSHLSYDEDTRPHAVTKNYGKRNAPRVLLS